MRTQSKTIKRISIIFIVMIIAAVLAGGNVFALSPVAGQKGSIIVHKFSSTTPGSAANNSGEALNPDSGLGTPLAGATFQLYKVTLPALDNDETLTGTYTIAPASGAAPNSITFTTSKGSKTGIINPTVLDTQTTPDTGVVTFGNVDQGYYILVETATPTGYTTSASSVISLPLTNKEGTGFNYKINVYPKNVSNVPITKVLDNTAKTYKVGDTVSFTINGAFKNNEADPNTVSSVTDMRTGGIGGTYGEMHISDKLMTELTYNNSTLKLLKADGSTVDMIADTDYTLTGTTTGDLKWTLTPAGIDKAIEAGATSVQVKLTTTLNSIATTGIKNNASSFVKKPGATVDPVTPTTPDTTVPVANIVIDKVNAANNAKLADAVFVLASDAAGTTFYKADGTPTTDITQALTATTSADGAAQFSGVDFDNTADKTFYLVEKAAPAGYQLKVNPIAVTFTKVAGQTSFTVNTTVKNYANGTTDSDSNKFALPMTGAMGSTFLLVTGIALMVSAVVIYVTYRKKRNNG